LFSLLNHEVPVFIDKYYQAKALSDMVIAVQSNVSAWESRLSCNKKPIYWDLRNPLKSTLSSVGLLLGGLIPAHIGYNPASNKAYQNWLWSVGDSPLAYTTRNAQFSSLHRDVVFRNYIVNGINDSVAVLNEGIAILQNQKTSILVCN
jgi:hypothetical protein